MFNGTFMEFERFKGIVSGISKLMPEIMLKVDKDRLYTSTLMLGASGYVFFEFKNSVFKNFKLDNDIGIILDTVSLVKILRLIKPSVDSGIGIRITDNDIKFLSVDNSSLDYEYVQKPYDKNASTLEEYSEDRLSSDLKFGKPSLEFIIDGSEFRKLVDSLKMFEQVTFKINWDMNGIVIKTEEKELVRFSMWFKKASLTFLNLIGQGKAEFPVSQIDSVTTFLSNDRIHISLFGTDTPILIENADQSKYRCKFMIAPYVSDSYTDEEIAMKSVSEPIPKKEDEIKVDDNMDKVVI